MAVKPETQLIKFVHDRLLAVDDAVYPEKTHNPYRAGIPDVYYDYPGHDMWVEYKHLPGVPAVLAVAHDPTDKVKPLATALQRRWLERAHDNGRIARIVVGFGKGKNRRFLMVEPYTMAWNQYVTRDFIDLRLLTVDELLDEYLELLNYGRQDLQN